MNFRGDWCIDAKEFPRIDFERAAVLAVAAETRPQLSSSFPNPSTAPLSMTSSNASPSPSTPILFAIASITTPAPLTTEQLHRASPSAIASAGVKRTRIWGGSVPIGPSAPPSVGVGASSLASISAFSSARCSSSSSNFLAAARRAASRSGAPAARLLPSVSDWAETPVVYGIPVYEPLGKAPGGMTGSVCSGRPSWAT